MQSQGVLRQLPAMQHTHTPAVRPPLLVRGCVREQPLCRPVRRQFPRRGQLHTVRVAALDEPAIETENPLSSSGTPAAAAEDQEPKYGMDETSAEVLYQKFRELVESGEFVYKPGELVTGRVESVDQRGAYVELGAKSPGFCSTSECSSARVDHAGRVLQPEQRREFQVLYMDNKRNQLVISLKAAEEKLLWQRFRQMMDEKISFNGKVTEAINVGVRAEAFGKFGFIPFSHFPYGSQAEELVGQEISMKFLDVDESRDRIVLTARKPRNTAAQATGLKVGDVVEGTVVTIQVYGAFVDLGNGLNGLLHVSQISHDRVNSVDSVLTVGDRLKVMILTKDASMGRVSLSTKKLEPSPGDMLRDPRLVFERADEMAEAFRAGLKRASDAQAAPAEEAAVVEEIPEPEPSAAA